ncbi:hypothetical protein LCGC14_2739720, partial [marine sediment metagenome]
ARDFLHSKGVDVMGELTTRGIVLIDIAIISCVANDWQHLSPESLIERLLTPLAAQKIRILPIVSGLKWAVTFGFQTREGGMGILQITEVEEDKKHFKIRYKMLQSSRLSNIANPPKTQIDEGSASSRKRQINAIAAADSAERNIKTTVEQFVALVLASKDKEAANLAVPGSPASRHAGDLRKLIAKGKLRIRNVYSDQTAAMVTTTEVQDDRGRKVTLTFYLQRKEYLGHSIWQVNDVDYTLRITDIDLQSAEEAFKKRIQFFKNHPNATEIPATQPGGVPIRFTSVEGLQNRWRLRLDLPEGMYLLQGWYSVVDGTIREHVGGGSKSVVGAGECEFAWKRERNMLELTRRPGSVSRTTWPEGAELRVTISDKPTTLYSERYALLWQGDFVKDGLVLKSVYYLARLASDADMDAGFLTQQDPITT